MEMNHDPEVIGVAGAFLGLSSIGVAARLASKRMMGSPLKIDDYLLIWAYILCIGESGMLIWACDHAGFGRHVASLSTAEIISFEKVFFAASLMQPCLLASTKVSVLILLRRVFITRAFRRTAEILMAIVIGWYIAISLATVFICSPINSLWNPEVPGHCGNQYLLNIVDPIPWILTDFAILIAPLPMVRKLQIPTRQKVALAGLFLVGDTVGLADWNIIEANVTVLCGGLIASKPVVMFFMPEKLISSMGSYFGRFSSHHKSTSGATQTYIAPNEHSFARLNNGASIELPRHATSTDSSLTKASQMPTHGALTLDF
ncbi:hypothetical protein MMC11_007314 [Xylographa trunciseda]|nr:hypothetical protein [Xylographa trunciseda]